MKKINIFITIFIIITIPIILINSIIIIKSILYPDKIPSIFGYKPFAVVSGSMESSIEIGDLVIVKQIEESKLKDDDIIAFKEKDDTVTIHRIVSKINSENGYYFETKGDSNNIKDENVVYSNDIEGIYVYKISKLGNFIIFVQQPLGFCIMMLSLIIIGLITFMIINHTIEKQCKIKNSKDNEENKNVNEKKNTIKKDKT